MFPKDRSVLKRAAGRLVKALAFAFIFLCPASGAQAADLWTHRDIYLSVPGIQKDYTFICIADLHIVAGTEGVAEKWLETAANRIFADSAGTPAAGQWRKMAGRLDEFNADAVLFAGDMIDFYSEQNMAALSEGLEKIGTPYMYIRADHDLGLWYCGLEGDELEEEERKRKEAESALCDNSAIPVMEFDDLIIAGFNRSTSQLGKSGVSALESLKEKARKTGKPVILVTHVPFQSVESDELDRACAEAWDGRSLLWGYKDAYYRPNERTGALLDYVYSEESQVRAVISGHLHFPFETYLTERTVQYTLAPAFSGEITLLHVSGN